MGLLLKERISSQRDQANSFLLFIPCSPFFYPPPPYPMRRGGKYEGESISNQANLFPVEIHLFFFDVIAF